MSKYLDLYINKLGLTWLVDTRIDQVEQPMISSEPTRKTHLISLPLGYEQKEEFWRTDLANVLIKAHLAETRDSIFASVRLDPDIDWQEAVNTQKAQQIYLAQQIVDVWVTDLMPDLDTSLVSTDIESWVSIALVLPDEIFKQTVYAIVLGYGLNSAQIARHDLSEYQQSNGRLLTRTNHVLGKGWGKKAVVIADLYTKAPELPEDGVAACLLFEKLVRESADILGFDVNPHIANKDNISFWQI